MRTFEDFLLEAFTFRVNSKAQKKRRLKCKPGYKPNPNGTACIPITAKQKQTMRAANRKRLRTVKAKGPALQRRASRKRKKAMRFRRNLGLK